MPQQLLFSVGHGSAPQEALLARLADGEVDRLVDIRTAPGSRRHPQYNRDRLAEWLPEAGVGYRWDPRLGGFRKPAEDSPDGFWENEAFRGYAAHLRTVEATTALAELVREAGEGTLAFMCSETLWWRCHRRLVSDALVLLHDCDVEHLMPGRRQQHPVSPGAVVGEDGCMYYPQSPA